MPLVKAQCENCNGILTVDSAKKAALCPYCETPYVVQDAINHYSTHIANLHTDVLNVYTGDSKDNLLRKADTYLSLGHYKRAEETYEKITELYPEEPRGWWGVYTTATKSFAYFHDLVGEYKHYATTAMKLQDYSAEYKHIWEELADTYCKELHFSDNAKNLWSKLSHQDVELMLFSSIDDIGNPYLKQIQAATLKNYYDAFVRGEISFFIADDLYHTVQLWSGQETLWPVFIPHHRTWHETCKVDNIPYLKRILDEGTHNANSIFQDDEYRVLPFMKEYVQYASKMHHEYSFIKNAWSNCIDYSSNSKMQKWAMSHSWDTPYKIVFLLGNTIVIQHLVRDYESGRNEPVYQILITNVCLSSEDIKELAIAHWKKEGRCTYCGGNLSRGFFFTKCDRCGKKKNY